jgi:2-hydroxycyclohexanecarboxyl-CoA dehydrogenase
VTVTLDSLAVVTGGGAGIGHAIALGLAEQGRMIAVLDVREEHAKKTAEEIVARGGRAEAFYVDIADMDSVTAVRDQVVAKYGPCQVLVNNAGWEEIHKFMETSSDFWQKILGINLLGPIAVTHAFLSGMVEAGNGGRVINISSDAGRVGSSGEVVYSGAKGGIIGFTKTAAKELARFGVTVNAISPNAETRMVASIPAEKLAELAAQIPMGRFAAPAEICTSVGYLASEEAGYVTGVVLPVDGGISI